MKMPGRSDATLSMYAYMPGQREMILGITGNYALTTMQVIHQTDMPPAFPAGGGRVEGGGLFEEALGNVHWSIKEDTFGGKKVHELICDGNLTERLTKTMQVSMADSTTFWVDDDGHIVRQYNKQIRPFATRVANCVYQKDSIDVSVEDEHGRRATSVFPNFDMSMLHDQFKPMIVDGKVVLEEKTFEVFDPFKMSFDKYAVRLSGSAAGTYFGMKFEGKAFEIVGPHSTVTAAVSKEGDLIKVDMPKDRFIVMQSIPPGKGG
jgi:hypothetical protein